MDTRLQKLEDYKKTLQQKDAILEKNIYNDALVPYLAQGGLPMDAVTLLAESYIGTPSMCNIISSAADSIGIDSKAVLREVIKQKFKERFDPKRCDDLYMNTENQQPPEWLDTIIKEGHWRQTIYELLEQYPRCAFLNFAVLKIADSGFNQEISNLRTASTYIEVYNSILNDSFSSIVPVDDLEFENRLPEIVRVCCEREETYLYAQIILQNLCENKDNLPFTRLSKELERAAVKNGQHGFVDILKTYLTDAPPQILSALKAIRSNQLATPGDIMVLYKLYYSNNPPPISHIRDFDLIVILLKTVFVPNSGSALKPDLREKLIYLIAYATTRDSTVTLESQEQSINEMCNILKELQVALNEKAKGESMTGAMKSILKAISLPVGSLALLLWIEYTSIHTPYFETYFRSSEVPVLHLLLDEIALQHPLQRPFVLNVIKTGLRHSYQNFAPEILMTLQKAWIDRLLYLVQKHYTLPVLKFIISAERELDDSLTVHFVQKVLRMAQPPYSLAFVEHMADILVPITEMLGLIKNVQAAVVEFFDEAQDDEQIVITDTLKRKIDSICHTKSKRNKT